MVCRRVFQPYLKFQLCCSSVCGEQAGREAKEVVEVRMWLDGLLQDAFRRAGYED
jgi:hypothetical protein